MGFLDRLGLGRKRSSALLDMTTVGIASQWAQPGNLGSIVISDALGVNLANLPLDRGTAMTVPAVSKGIHLLTSSIARFPLRALTDQTQTVTITVDGAPVQVERAVPVANQPTWLYRTNGQVSPYARMVATVTDCIFDGVSLWLTTRGADGRILDAEWCPSSLWELRPDGRFYIEGRKEPLQDTEMILFDVPMWDGLLSVGAGNLRGAKDVEKSWQGRARNPIPVMVLKVEDGTDYDQEEIDAYVEAWADARKSENGAVGFLPAGISMEVHGEVSPDLMLQGRNAVKTDVANYLNVPTTLLDGSLSEASLTYTTQDGNRNTFYELSLPRWTDAIAHRLSQDDCVPRGQRVRFDFYEQYAPTPSPTGPTELD